MLSLKLTWLEVTWVISLLPLTTLSSWERWRASFDLLVVVTLQRADSAPNLSICNRAGAEDIIGEPVPRVESGTAVPAGCSIWESGSHALTGQHSGAGSGGLDVHKFAHKCALTYKHEKFLLFVS